MDTFLLFLLAIIVIGAIWVIGAYNGLIVIKNRVAEAFSDIDVQLKRRYDLIPNLINTVKGYAEHEKGVFEKVTQARSAAMGAGSENMASKAKAENMLSETLKSLFAVAENYPDLKANQNFLALQEELSNTENKIMSARRFYNNNVKDLNTKQEVFPTNLIAKQLGFKKADFFDLDETPLERENPKVDFSS
ncbi:MAG: LemA family protein [Patescibacteria group bacterium]|nr:LemA family protein [Patescibacteria group bacterium]